MSLETDSVTRERRTSSAVDTASLMKSFAPPESAPITPWRRCCRPVITDHHGWKLLRARLPAFSAAQDSESRPSPAFCRSRQQHSRDEQDKNISTAFVGVDVVDEFESSLRPGESENAFVSNATFADSYVYDEASRGLLSCRRWNLMSAVSMDHAGLSISTSRLVVEPALAVLARVAASSATRVNVCVSRLDGGDVAYGFVTVARSTAGIRRDNRGNLARLAMMSL
jgi:hypothetical protein